MRWSNAALLALPAAILSSLVAAVPSPAYGDQHPFSASTADSTERSRWRKLSGRVIDTIWSLRGEDNGRSLRMPKAVAQAPPHTLARYGGDVVLRFNISSHEEAESLAEATDTLLLDVWEFTREWVDVRLSTDIVGPLLGLLPASLHHSHTPLLRERDLAQAIYETYPKLRSQSTQEPRPAYNPPSLQDRPFGQALRHSDEETNLFFNDYQPLSVIEPWMRLMASVFATHVRKINIGVSYQGRDVPGLRVGVHPTNDDEANPPKRKTVLIFGGLHAREWISTSTVNYLAYSLITGYGKVPSITRMLEDFDFVFVPTVNPDGYVYTWEADRLWRKNRQNTDLRFCQGIDLDRSFGFEWDGASTTAGNPCSESFAGEQPFEAVETKRLADWAKNEVENNNVDLVGMLDLHSYSQQILYPYSYSCDDTPPGLENLEELAMGLGKAIRHSHGHSYEVMAACEGNSVAAEGSREKLRPRMEASGGSALDWFYHELKVRYAYQVKLRDRGMYGFLLPKENIVPTGKEILSALLHFGSFLSETYGVDGASRVQGMEEAEAEAQDLEEEPEQVDVIDPIRSFPIEEAESEVEEEWIWVNDADMEDVQWELKRRRRR
ncbi:hypothetical protein B0A50_03138 [Salinomyces thailandicus]|uniref:Inactive metallocarboxypeptidase ECM14 n=1 Tax=Salinomyces thailandicus TaxID=706561 RepID=A0A4U0U4J1_9PEZI|nr:hypothetical protein B0A50_03138 [Salinomyces thailandica]